MNQLWKRILLVVVALIALNILNLTVIERVQAYVDTKNYLARRYVNEPLDIKKVELDLIYGKYLITVEPEHAFWANPEFRVSWSFKTKEVTLDTRADKRDGLYWTIDGWEREYARIINEWIGQNYTGRYQDYFTGVRIFTFRVCDNPKQVKLVLDEGNFPTNLMPAEIILRFHEIPEEEAVYMAEEGTKLKSLLLQAGYDFETYYLEFGLQGYQLTDENTCVRQSVQQIYT